MVEVSELDSATRLVVAVAGKEDSTTRLVEVGRDDTVTKLVVVVLGRED